MNQRSYISPRIFVFSKWSRKEYAVFASLGKLIKIGVLKIDICRKALLKGLIDSGNISEAKEDFNEEDVAWNISDHDSLQLMLSSFGLSALPTFNLASVAAPEKANPLKAGLFNEYEVCFLLSVRNRLFFATHRNITNH